MQINKIYPRFLDVNTKRQNANNQINFTPIEYNSLQSQLNFKGTINKTLIRTPIDSGSEVLSAYFKKLHPYKLPGITILSKQEGARNAAQVFILNERMKLSDSMRFFDELIKAIKTYGQEFPLSGCDFFRGNFRSFNEAITRQEIPDVNVKGIIGTGYSSTAFLTSDNKVLKLSVNPNFPSKEHFVSDVDVPIFQRYVAHTTTGKPIFGVLEALTECAKLRFDKTKNQDILNFQEIWDFLNRKLRVKTTYNFGSDFERDNPISIKQVGFIGDTPYLIDHECIENRLLVGQS